MPDSTVEIHQFLQLTVQETDGRGNNVRFVGIPQWLSSDQHVIKVLPSPDGLTAMATPQGVGIADIIVSADGLSGIWNVEVTGPRIIFQSVAATN